MRNLVKRLLVKKKIPFRAHALPPEKLTALEAAEFLHAAPETVYKTIVTLHRPDQQPILALVPAAHQVDLKALARGLGLKKIHLTTQREAEAITGLETGGISPLALLHRRFTVVLDQSIRNHEQIFLSGGQRGLNVQLAPTDLITLTRARILPISKPEGQSRQGNERAAPGPLSKPDLKQSAG